MKSVAVSRAVHLLETKFRAALRIATRLQPHVARQRKAKWGVLKSVAVSRAVHLLETKFRAALRTATRLQPHVARQRKAKWGDLKSVVVSRVVHLLLHFVSHTVFLRIKDS
ncbi:hypothetical protein [Pilibacter termitis]|uniref:hypothetical protein n=1 Tax=Pilibacter termitis TaxID=263852 RepID=UPI000999C2B7|nr:hypothetical protein [Pilibacter termitis]